MLRDFLLHGAFLLLGVQDTITLPCLSLMYSHSWRLLHKPCAYASIGDYGGHNWGNIWFYRERGQKIGSGAKEFLGKRVYLIITRDEE